MAAPTFSISSFSSPFASCPFALAWAIHLQQDRIKEPSSFANNSLLLLGSDKTLIKAVVAPLKPAGACCRFGPWSFFAVLAPACIQLHLVVNPTLSWINEPEMQSLWEGLPVHRYSASKPLETGKEIRMESSAGRLFGNCILGLGVFLWFLAKQSLIPAWEKGRSQGCPSAHHWALLVADLCFGKV